MVDKYEVLNWILRGLISVALIVCGFFIKRVMTHVDTLPTNDKVHLLVEEQLKPLEKDVKELDARVIRLEEALMGLATINQKLTIIQDDLTATKIDVATIKERVK